MKPYHGKVCSQSRCCVSTYECYGNCGDYTELYIFLVVVAVVLALCGLNRRFQLYRKFRTFLRGREERITEVMTEAATVGVPMHDYKMDNAKL